MKIKYNIFLLFFFCICLTSNAQLLTYKTISTDDGLLSNEIHTVIQDSKGYVWIGTRTGLCRWDSKNFEYFTIADGLPNNEVLSLYEDSIGRIWIGCFSRELCYFFEGHIYNRKNTPFLKKINIYPGTSVMVYNNELYYKDRWFTKYNFLTQKQTISSDSTSDAYAFIYTLYKNKVWGIHDERNKIKREEKGFKNFIYSIDTSYSTPYLLCANVPNNDIITRIDFGKKLYGFQKGFDSMFYRANYAYNGFQMALYNYGKILEVYKEFIFQSVDKYILKVNFSDRESVFAVNNNLYAPVANGLLFCRQIPILEYQQDGDVNNAKLIFKYNDEIYVVNNKYQIINIKTQKKVNDLSDNPINLYNLIKYGNKFYLATSFHIYHFSDPNGRIAISSGRYYGNFKYIASSKKRNYFFTANGGHFGINLTDFQPNVSDTLFTDLQIAVYSVYEDSKSRLWYSSTDKVFYTKEYYNGVKNSKEFILDSSTPLFCKSIQEDNKGNLFFTTNGGVFIYDGKKKYRICKSNLLSDNECNKVVIDTVHNSFWVATKDGLNQIGYSGEKGGLKFRVLSKFFATDGLRSDNINDLLLDSNKLFIATDKGVNILDDINYHPDTTHIPIYIRLKAINATANKAYDTSKAFELKYYQNNLTIGFSALYFLRRDRLKVKAYLYRNGALVSQNEITEDKIDYYSLNEGDYKLVLYAYDEDYRYNNGRSVPFAFTIKPPYYKTWWFLGGSSLLVIIITTALLFWNLNRRKKSAVKQAELQAKLNESTLKSLQSQMNPHFVFNSLNTIQSFITEKNEEGAIDYLSDFSGLIREILEQSAHTFISLENEIQFLRQYIQLEITRYKGSFDVAWDIDLDEDDLTDIYIPTMLIQPILENAVKHGVSGLTGIKGHINVRFRLEYENMLKVTITDNGQPSLNKKLKGNSIAVKTIRERLNIYTKNNLKGEYHLEVSETGAIATITIPI